VVLIVDRAEVFPDNWIYVHSPDVRVGPGAELQELEPGHGAGRREDRSASSTSSSRATSCGPPPTTTSPRLAAREIERLGLARGDEVIDGDGRPHAQGLSGLRPGLP
jgi:hypothetical protein